MYRNLYITPDELDNLSTLRNDKRKSAAKDYSPNLWPLGYIG